MSVAGLDDLWNDVTGRLGLLYSRRFVPGGSPTLAVLQRRWLEVMYERMKEFVRLTDRHPSLDRSIVYAGPADNGMPAGALWRNPYTMQVITSTAPIANPAYVGLVVATHADDLVEACTWSEQQVATADLPVGVIYTLYDPRPRIPMELRGDHSFDDVEQVWPWRAWNSERPAEPTLSRYVAYRPARATELELPGKRLEMPGFVTEFVGGKRQSSLDLSAINKTRGPGDTGVTWFPCNPVSSSSRLHDVGGSADLVAEVERREQEWVSALVQAVHGQQAAVIDETLRSLAADDRFHRDDVPYLGRLLEARSQPDRQQAAADGGHAFVKVFRGFVRTPGAQDPVACWRYTTRVGR